jgi:hypothetical protein
MFGYFYDHIYLKITEKPQIPFLKEMVFVKELFFWLKKKVKKIRKIESNLTSQGRGKFFFLRHTQKINAPKNYLNLFCRWATSS